MKDHRLSAEVSALVCAVAGWWNDAKLAAIITLATALIIHALPRDKA